MDSIASAIKAKELPNMPANVFMIASITLPMMLKYVALRAFCSFVILV
jgi:hypothetical protein